jgi:hypothetical protein
LKQESERANAINEGLPLAIYITLILGLLINILISWQINIENRSLEIFAYTLTGILAGSQVFINVAMPPLQKPIFSY